MFWVSNNRSFFINIRLTKSGTILFSDQSPPPITFPALAVLILIFLDIIV